MLLTKSSSRKVRVVFKDCAGRIIITVPGWDLPLSVLLLRHLAPQLFVSWKRISHSQPSTGGAAPPTLKDMISVQAEGGLNQNQSFPKHQ